MQQNISKLEIAIKSPAFWAMIGVFLLAGISAIIPQLQGTPELIAVAAVAGLGALLHPAEVQRAGDVGISSGIRSEAGGQH